MSRLSKRSRIILLIVVVVALAAGGYWLFLRQTNPANGSLTASGTVEATQVMIAPEISGKVTEIMVDEGDSFQAGDPLFRLDGEMLETQRKQAAAAVQAAQDNLSASQAGVEAAQAALAVAQANAEVAKTNAEAERIPVENSLKDLYDNAGVVKSSAEQTLAAATRAVREAQYQLDNFSVPTDQQGLTLLDALEMTKARLDQARANFEPYKYVDSGNQTRKDLKEALDEAQSGYDTAVRRMELITALDQALARQQKAMQDMQAVQNGPKAEDVAALQARLAAIQAAPQQAEAAVVQAQTGITQAQARLDQADSALAQSQAALDTIDLQIGKLVIYAPQSGVLLARGIETGEIVQAGAPVMILGLLNDVTITVYVPEDRYGEVYLGEQAQVTVDSFPSRVFVATVKNIAEKAEFTPRNVQTVEGRKTTVFAVRLSIANNDQALKLGMPADVVFEKP